MIYEHQDTGADFLNSGDYRYLCDGMGMGKTIQSLLALTRKGVESATVVCPARAIGNWKYERGVWAPDVRLEVVSYASLNSRRPTPGQAVVLDEAHYAKNQKAKRTGLSLGLLKEAGQGHLLSGTPGRNASNLWTVFDACWPELLKKEYRSYHKWLHYFCNVRQTQYGPKVYGHKLENLPELKALMAKVMLRRDDGVDLPPLRVTMHLLKKSAVFNKAIAGQAAGMDAIEREKAKGDKASSSRLRRLLGELKAPMIADLLAEELKEEQYPKIVVGYYHTAAGNLLEEKLKPFGLVRLDGKTPRAQSQPRIDQFNNDPGTRVFLGQQTATGTALNLQSAYEIALTEPDWTPDPNRQFIKRIHRIGQDHRCRARVFGVEGSLDENIMRNIAANTQHQKDLGLRG